MGSGENNLRKIVGNIRKFEWDYLKITKEGLFTAGLLRLKDAKFTVVFNLDSVFYIEDAQGSFAVDDYKATFFRPKTSPCDVSFPEEIHGAEILAIPIRNDSTGAYEGIYWNEQCSMYGKLSEQDKDAVTERLKVITSLSEYEIRDLGL